MPGGIGRGGNRCRWCRAQSAGPRFISKRRLHRKCRRRWRGLSRGSIGLRRRGASRCRRSRGRGPRTSILFRSIRSKTGTGAVRGATDADPGGGHDSGAAAQDRASGFLIDKTRLLDQMRGQLNARQEKALLRMLREGPEGSAGAERGDLCDHYRGIARDGYARPGGYGGEGRAGAAGGTEVCAVLRVDSSL